MQKYLCDHCSAVCHVPQCFLFIITCKTFNTWCTFLGATIESEHYIIYYIAILYIPMKRWMATFEGCISSLRSVQDREAGGWSPNFQFKPKLTSNRSHAFTYFIFTLRTKCVLWYFGKFVFVVLFHLKQGAREDCWYGGLSIFGSSCVFNNQSIIFDQNLSRHCKRSTGVPLGIVFSFHESDYHHQHQH